MKAPDNSLKGHPQTPERPPFSLDSYMNVHNPCERHIESMATSVLHALARISDQNLYYALDDDLDIFDKFEIKKHLVQFAPDLSELDISELLNPSREMLDPSDNLVNSLSIRDPQLYDRLSLVWKKEDEKYLDFLDAASRGAFIATGTSTQNVGMHASLIYGDVTAPLPTRINIKVHPLDHIGKIQRELFQKFISQIPPEHPFQMKSLMGDYNARDGIIIYASPASFEAQARIVSEYFSGNSNYDDRHADPGVIGGVSLKTASGRGFPGIRITCNPKGTHFGTFNSLQAHILSGALSRVLKTHYQSNKQALFARLSEDWFTEYQNFCIHLGAAYKVSATQFLGSDANLSNIAFIDGAK